tara:strand:- start:62 stop:241 length:180 start_codon:yes stop_codon:yes gene_type:complete
LPPRGRKITESTENVREDGVLCEEEDTDINGTDSESDVEREEGDTDSSGTNNESDVGGF